MDIASWLQGLGLTQYEQAFLDNHIDADVLVRLMPDDLRELGVASIGHRRRLLDAIAALAIGEASRPASASAPSTPEPAPQSQGERRQLTVMFCDLVGSTALSARFDPEDLRDMIAVYQRTVAEAVGRFAGYLAKYMGDGVLIYFGYPHAHEDDAERAVRAGLALLDAVADLPTPAPLRAHIGVATGLVVVGDLIGEGAAQERGVVGETPNLAARLEGLAPAGTLVIDETTRRQLGRLFDLEDLGLQSFDGFFQPQQAWRVLHESGAVSRFEALRSDATPLVGRDEELELALRRWRQAKTGEGRVVLISGEPGIGKSRLAAALFDAIGDDPHTRLRWFCAPHHQNSALQPVIAQVEAAAGFTRGDAPEQRRDKAIALLAPGGDTAGDFELLAELLSLPNTTAELNLSAQRKREILFEALLRQLVELSRRTPVLAIFEDAHWIDPTSRELLDLMVERVKHLPVLLVITFRPEFQAPWGGQAHITSLVLNRLAGRDVGSLVLGIAGNAPLGDAVVEEIVERTDGVPLFVEELTKAVLEGGAADHRVAAVLSAIPVSTLAVPPTLHASLISRLDRIGVTAREVAQIGSVLGREFGYELIAPVARRPEPELQLALGQLTEAGLLFCRGEPPHSSYLFKHALVQDAAYGTLLRARRRQLHAQVAAVLERHFPDIVERQPELLAHHLTGASDAARAVDQWLKAGQHAATRLTHLEAVRHFERGLNVLPELPEGPARDRQEIELQLARGLSLFTAEGFQAAEAAASYGRADELAARQGDRRQQFMATYGLWQSANGAGRIADCRRLSARLQQLTTEDADDELRLEAHHSAWATCLFSGEPAAARDHCEAGHRLYDPERHRFLHERYGGHDPGLCAGYFGAQAHWLLGYPDQSLALGTRALTMAKRIAHPFSFALALQYNAIVHLDRGEPALALERLASAEALAAEQRLSFVVEPQLLRGAILAAQGEFGEAIVYLRQGLGGAGAARVQCYGFAWLARTFISLGDHRAAGAAAAEGLETANRTGHRQWEAELHRLHGLALCGLNDLDKGQLALQTAIGRARRQQAKSYELRAAMSLARLWSETGRRSEATELLAPIFGWFTEGFDTLDLKEAASLLNALP